MDDAERRELVARYKEGYRVVRDALEQIGADRLDLRQEPGGWSPREVVHHLADSETIGAIRLRRLIADERPEIAGYDEAAFARTLYYDRPLGTSLELMRAARAATAEILDRLSEEEWTREGTHSDSGAFSVEQWLRAYVAHAHDHAAQMLRAAGLAPAR